MAAGPEPGRGRGDGRPRGGAWGAHGRRAPGAGRANVRYLQDLIQGGYVGEVLSTSVVASGVNWGATFRPGGDYMLDRANGATMLTVPFAHTIDLLTMVLGELSQFNATVSSRRTEASNRETGEVKPMNVADQIVLNGTLEGGAVASVHFRGGTSRGTSFLWEINGTDGDVLVTLDSPPVIQFARATLRGGRADEMTLTDLPVPSAYERAPALAGHQPETGYNLAHAYAQVYRDLNDGTRLTPDFAHAVHLHHLLARIQS